MTSQIKKKINNESGFALLLAIIISSVALSIGLTILNVTLKQLALSAAGRESEVAFQMANLGMECGRNWRAQLADEFRDGTDGAPFPSSADLAIDCAGVSNERPEFVDDNFRGVAGSYHARYKFDVPVSGQNRCVIVEINVLDAVSDINDWDFGGRFGSTCDTAGFCTVVVSQGYNRPCSGSGSITDSIYSVQRELVAEY